MTNEPNTNMLYIHQFPDWTRFRFDSPKVLQALGQTRLEEGKLIGIMQICGLKDIEAKLLAEDIVANYAIDGYTLDSAQTLAEVELKSKGSQNYIKNYLGAIHNASQPLTDERIFNWHSAMGQNKVKHYRDTPSEVQTTIDAIAPDSATTLRFTGPNPERLQSEMENFLSWFESANIDGVIKAAIAHFWFITIRPFADANGRLARAITAMQLARAENTTHCQYALNKQIYIHKNDYFKILARTQAASGDLTEFCGFCKCYETPSRIANNFSPQKSATSSSATPTQAPPSASANSNSLTKSWRATSHSLSPQKRSPRFSTQATTPPSAKSRASWIKAFSKQTTKAVAACGTGSRMPETKSRNNDFSTIPSQIKVHTFKKLPSPLPLLFIKC